MNAVHRGKWLVSPVGTAGIRKPEIGQNGLPGHRRLTFEDQRLSAFRQVNVEPRSEPDQPEPFACADRLTFADKRHDAPRNKARDLDHADTAVRRGDNQRVTFVVLTGLVEFGIDERARPIRDAIDPAGYGATIHVTVEHAHKDRDT